MNLVERAKRILLNPAEEWRVIDGEQATVQGLYTGYIMPLAAIGAIAQVVGYSVFGMSFMGTTYRTPIGSAVTGAIVTYGLTLVGVYVLALVIDALAPTFDGTRNQIQALKVAAYSSTASWVAAVFAVLPGLRILTILGLYSLYLLYLGLPVLMKAPAEKAMGYTVVVIIAAIVLFMLVGLVAGAVVSPVVGLGA
ncbi:MAG TPA: Yip1 family protein [Gemmatimonadales bacterium]|nr:Yip1 family protein [Gemmatimonadales bacterium]